jgi:hypothetical protein
MCIDVDIIHITALASTAGRAGAVRFTSGFSLDQYLADEKTRVALEPVLEVRRCIERRAKRV